MTHPPITPPDAIVRLPTAFHNFQQALTVIGQEPHLPEDAVRTVTPESVLRRIGSNTGTYLWLSSGGDRSIHIWGQSERVIAARNLLETLIRRCEKGKVTRETRRWARTPPHWADRETFEMTRKQQEILLRALKTQPEKLDPNSETLIYEWPSEDLTMIQCLGEGLEKLDNIRMCFKVHIYPSSDVESHICVAGYQKGDAEPILAWLGQLSQEAIKKFDTPIKAYMVESPSYDASNDQVVIHRYPHGAEPSLQREEASSVKSEESWIEERKRIKEANIELILSSLETSLSMCHSFKADIRMRVHFGSFVLDTFQRPKDGLAGHTFENFRNMLALDKSKGRLVPRARLRLGWDKVLERCSNASNLIEPMHTKKPLSSIGSMQPNYSASFEFAEPYSRLRLETYFKTVFGSCEIEAAGHRWFELRRGAEDKGRHMSMQISMLDFGRCDWQLDLEHFEPLDADTINLRAELESFAAAVAFDGRLTSEQCGFSGQGVKKILFPPQPSVSRCIEKSALQFKIKGTDYILELVRFDEHKPASPAKQEVNARNSATWAATLFHPQWASELEGRSPSDAAQSGRPDSKIDNFFPSSSGLDCGGREGFEEFMNLVRKVADLLGCPRDRGGPNELLQVDFGTLF